jgi:hypothetical protein
VTRRKLQSADDPTQGQYAVVVSFRFHPREGQPDADWLREVVPDILATYLHEWEYSDLDVAVREIGAQGERGTDEGRWDTSADDAVPGPSAAPGRPQGVG